MSYVGYTALQHIESHCVTMTHIYHSSYRLHEDETGELLHDELQFIFLELARFNKTEQELDGYYDKWMYLFKNIQRLHKRPESFSEKEFDRLFDMVKIND